MTIRIVDKTHSRLEQPSFWARHNACPLALVTPTPTSASKGHSNCDVGRDLLRSSTPVLDVHVRSLGGVAPTLRHADGWADAEQKFWNGWSRFTRV